MSDRRDLGLDDDENVLAELTVQYARRFDRDLRLTAGGRVEAPDARASAAGALFGNSLGRRPMSGIGRYKSWAQHADAAGFPVGGMAMRLGVTDRRLIVWSATFVRSRAKHFVGDVPLRRIVQATASRTMGGGRLHLLLEGEALVTLETMTPGRARRFASELLAARDRLRA